MSLSRAIVQELVNGNQLSDCQIHLFLREGKKITDTNNQENIVHPNSR